MAIGFDNVHLQQHLIEKLQDRINQEVEPEKEMNPSDAESFKVQMGNGEQMPTSQSNQALHATSDTSSIEKTGSGSFNKSPGDQILETLQEMGKDAMQIDNVTSAQSMDRMSVSEELKMQVQVTKLGAEESVISSTAGKASKDVESLLKNQ